MEYKGVFLKSRIFLINCILLILWIMNVCDAQENDKLNKNLDIQVQNLIDTYNQNDTQQDTISFEIYAIEYFSKNNEIKTILNKIWEKLDENKTKYTIMTNKILKKLKNVELKFSVIENFHNENYNKSNNSINTMSESILLLKDISKNCLETEINCSDHLIVESIKLSNKIESKLIVEIEEKLHTSVSLEWFEKFYNKLPDIAKKAMRRYIFFFFHTTHISFLMDSFIFQTVKPWRAKVLACECLFEIIKENGDVLDSKKIFDYAKSLAKNFNFYKFYMPIESEKKLLQLSFKLPECIRSFAFNPNNVCVGYNNTHILTSYENDIYLADRRFYLDEGSCAKKSINDKQIWFYQPFNYLKGYTVKYYTLKSVSFQLASDNEQCFILVNGKYVTRLNNSLDTTLEEKQTVGGIWHVTKLGGY